MSTATSAITDQAGVNGAGSFDDAASSLLDLGGTDSGGDASYQEQTQGAPGTKTTDAGDGGTETEGKTGDAAATGATQDTQQQATTTELKVDEWAIDQTAIDKLLADPVHGAIVKQLAEQRAKLLGYRDHWSMEEAAELRSMAPGGMEEIKASVTAGREARAENLEFASGDPARQANALKSLATSMPEAFAAGVTPYLETLKASNPEAYSKAVGQIATEALRAEGLPDLIGSHFAAIDALMRAAEAGDEKAFSEAFARVTGAQEFRGWADKAGIKGQATAARTAVVNPEVAKLQKELEGYKAKETSAQQGEANKIIEEFNTFTHTVDKAWQETAKPEVEKLLEVIPKNIPAKLRDGLMNDLRNNIMGDLHKRVAEELEKGYGDLKGKVDAVVTNRAWKTNADKVRDQVSNLLWARAKVLLPHVAKPIIDRYAEATVASAQARAEKDEKTSSRTDIRGGGAGPRGTGPVKVEDVRSGGRHANMSDEEILEL